MSDQHLIGCAILLNKQTIIYQHTWTHTPEHEQQLFTNLLSQVQIKNIKRGFQQQKLTHQNK
jgi:hypothetical protein